MTTFQTLFAVVAFLVTLLPPMMVLRWAYNPTLKNFNLYNATLWCPTLVERAESRYDSTDGSSFNYTKELAECLDVEPSLDFSGFVTPWNWSTAGENSYAQTFQSMNWHPLLMTLAFGTFFSCAILAFRVLPLSHVTRKIIHGTCQTIALMCAIIGVYNVRKFKHASGNGDFYTLHAQLGIFACAAFALQWLAGELLFLVPGWVPLAGKTGTIRKRTINWHRFFGDCIYLLTTAAIVTGALTREWIYAIITGDSTFPHGAPPNVGFVGIGFMSTNIIGFVTVIVWFFVRATYRFVPLRPIAHVEAERKRLEEEHIERKRLLSTQSTDYTYHH